jgi:hypothetical protein
MDVKRLRPSLGQDDAPAEEEQKPKCITTTGLSLAEQPKIA